MNCFKTFLQNGLVGTAPTQIYVEKRLKEINREQNMTPSELS